MSNNNTPTTEKLSLTVKEAAELMGVSAVTMYTLARREDFPCVRIGGRKIVISRKGFEAWFEKFTSGELGER